MAAVPARAPASSSRSKGEASGDIVMRGNSLARAQQPLLVADDVSPDVVWHEERVPHRHNDRQA